MGMLLYILQKGEYLYIILPKTQRNVNKKYDIIEKRFGFGFFEKTQIQKRRSLCKTD
jgi:hypothetical protein